MRVLIVEDSDSICRMIQALVAARGFEVRSAATGAKGLEEATPVIIISAMNDDEVKRRAAAVGANAFYDKPFSPLALLKEIEALSRKSEAAMMAARASTPES